MVLKKYEIEAALHAERQDISAGKLKEDNPLDSTDEFRRLCDACRRGDLKLCQEQIQVGVNINARDKFDYTPLILASLCGHYEVVQLLLESGALCERDTFQGERCLYNALNDRIRNLLLSYDYSKARDPLQPLAGHITSLLHREVPQTSDITLVTDSKSFHLHKFILSARSPYFAKKLAAAPDTTSLRVASFLPIRSLETAIVAIYFGEVGLDLTDSEEDQAVLSGIQKLGKQLVIGDILETVLENDRRLARQRRTEEIERGREQLATSLDMLVLGNKMRVDTAKADDVKWDRQNGVFADVLLCADEDLDVEDEIERGDGPNLDRHTSKRNNITLSPDDSTLDSHSKSEDGIPIGPSATETSRSASPVRRERRSVLFPAHRCMLLRSEYFLAMFSSSFREAQPSEYLPVVHVDCSPAVLEIILAYLYSENTSFTLDVAIEVLFAADQLFIEKLKVKAAIIISTLGNGAASSVESENARFEVDADEVVDIYDVVRAAWDTRVHRLEEFGARYIAYRLERYIDEEDFKQLVRESAARIQLREATDTVELIDDIRFYLSERFRLRFEDTRFDEMTKAVAGAAENPSDQAMIKDNDEQGADMDQVTRSVDTRNTQVNGEEPSDAAAAELYVETGVVRTLDGDIAGDEFAQDALNYQILMGKIDRLLEGLDLDA